MRRRLFPNRESTRALRPEGWDPTDVHTWTENRTQFTGSVWAARRRAAILRCVHPRVETTSTAERQLRTVPGLYDRVEQQLLDVLRSARAARSLERGAVPLSGSLRLDIAGFVVWYELDVDAKVARIVAVESRVPSAAPGSAGKSPP